MTDDYRREAETAIENLKVERRDALKRLELVGHAILTNERIIELTEKLKDA